MFKCFDRSVSALEGFGYNLIRYPRSAISPLDILSEARRGLEWLGPMSNIWHTSREIPEIQEGPAPSVQVKRSAEYKGEAGIQILKSLGPGLKIDPSTSLSRATTMSFTFDQVSRRFVEPLKIGDYLRNGVMVNNPFVEKLGEEDDLLNIFVVSDVLISRFLSVSLIGRTQADVKADIAALSGFGTAEVRNSGDTSLVREIVYDSGVPLAFAFKAFELVLRDGDWYVVGATALPMAGGSAASRGPHIFDNGAVRIRP